MTSSARKIRAAEALALVAAVMACSSPTNERSCGSPPSLVPDSALDGLLLSADEINKIMGIDAIVANPPSADLHDNRIFLPNINCLGIHQVGEKAIYGDSGFTGIRNQLLRQPDSSDWDALVMQAAVTYPSADAAKALFDASADRWSQCTNHRVNITTNDQPTTTWTFGDLTKTNTELVTTLVRGENERSCQRVLSVDGNVVIDVRACSRTATDQAATIAQDIKCRLSHREST